MIRVFSDPQSLSLAVAQTFVEASARSLPGQRFSVALAGGSTPRGAYELLAAVPLRDQVPWERVHVFWGDERCVPPTDPHSNERMAREAFLDRVPIPPGQLHPIRCGRDSREAARRYEEELTSFFDGPVRLDLVLLGLGEDGHTASLKPGTSALDVCEHLVAEVPDRGEGFDRLTLTVPALDQGRQVVFAVSGRGKAHVLRRVLEGPFRPEQLPAQLVHPIAGELLWLVDEAAASELDRASIAAPP